MKLFITAVLFMLAFFPGQAQWVAGPMLGPVELREAKVWISVVRPDNEVVLKIKKKGTAVEKLVYPETFSKFEFNTCTFTIGGLEPSTTYSYEVLVKDGKSNPESRTGSFTTKVLFQWRNPAPDFSFLTGSCSYFNEPEYDRPGIPYGKDSSIFETMAGEKAGFMLWLGDNWYTRDVDYQSQWGLWYRAARDRSMPVVQKFLSSMSHIAIWDDHDYGPNDYGKSYILKDKSREVFSHLWLNPSYGDGQHGTYTRYQYNDVDFFMLDDRWWRDAESLPDSIMGKPNPQKRMFGKQQMEWLKDELRMSQNNPFISFKVIVTGSQVLNPVSTFDKMVNFPVEYYELMDFIRKEKIEGVLFLTGDRHHSEIIKVKQSGIYPLYDITCSPLTSGTHTFGGKEANNPYRVVGVDKLQNYGRIAVTGAKGSRAMTIEFAGLKGETIDRFTIEEKELSWKK